MDVSIRDMETQSVTNTYRNIPLTAMQPLVLTERHSLCVVRDGNWDKNGENNNSIVTSSFTFLITVQYLCLICLFSPWQSLPVCLSLSLSLQGGGYARIIGAADINLLHWPRSASLVTPLQREANI